PRVAVPFPYTTLFRSIPGVIRHDAVGIALWTAAALQCVIQVAVFDTPDRVPFLGAVDRHRHDRVGPVRQQLLLMARPVRGAAVRSEEHTSELQSRENL